MQFIAALQATAEHDESIFRRQLAKEDLARFDMLSILINTVEDLAAFKKEGLYIGWTQSDMKTHELRDAINELLEAYFAYVREGASPERESAVAAAWTQFNRDRMEKLIHCL